MKKIYSILTIIVLLSAFNGYSQQSYFKAPAGTATTTVRVPNGTSAHGYVRGCFVIPASELCGITTVTALNSVGFCLVNGCGSAAVTGSIQIYLENTSDVNYTKGTIWSSAIAPMTSVYNSTMTIPLTAGANTINLVLPTAFTYTGGGLYVAYDWYSTGPFETGPTIANSQAATNITFGGASQSSNSAPPVTIVNTNTRPNFNLGYINTFTNEISIQTIISHGKIPIVPSAPYTFSVVAKNQASVAATNVTLNLAMSGVNAFATSTTVASIPANGTVIAMFPGFTPTIQGTSAITISALPDDNNCNNTAVVNQSVTCEVLSLGQPSSAVNVYSLGVGYNAGGSSIVMRFKPSAPTATVYAVDCGIGSDPSNVGKPVFAILLNSSGGLLAASNTLILTSAHLNKFITFYFPTPISLTNVTYYHVGMSQPTGPHFPYAVMPVNYIPNNFFYQSNQLGGFVASFAQSFGMFAFEPIFDNGISLTVNSGSLCSGNSMTLTANSSLNNYSWTPTASTASQIVVTPSISTLYEVYTSTAATCFAKKGAVVTVYATPTITVPNGGICPTPGSYTFTPSGAATYTYLPVGPVDSPTITTQYTVVGSSTAGCISNVATPSIIVTNSVVLSVVSPSAVCIGKSGTLTASGASSYSWTTSPGSTLNPIVVTPAVPNTYGLYGTVGTCTAFTTVFVNVNPNPTVTIAPSRIVYCVDNGPTTMTASGAATYSWNTGSTTNTAAATPTSVITYSVLGTDVNGCIDVEYFTLGPAASPTITASTSDGTICINGTATITASGALSSYSWTGNTSTTSIAIVSPTVTTTYTVTGFNPNTCYGTYTITQFVDPCVGVKEIGVNSIKAVIYPNPNTGAFNISISAVSDDMSIELYNVLGALMHSQPISNTTTAVDMSKLSNGVYLAKIKEGSQVIETMRVIKQ
ncbi:MAG: T9SS type A sorting domain-containing protein [Sphingobacteriaceae bacterium]|nr:T9SS type A sorting domain-containing protein [Sphingobacteriaceae bacterium]